MSETTKSVKRGRGRPRQYLDDADRQEAHRERHANAHALGQAARTLFEKPTLRVAEVVIDRLLAQASDPEAIRVALRARLDGSAKS